MRYWSPLIGPHTLSLSLSLIDSPFARLKFGPNINELSDFFLFLIPYPILSYPMQPYHTLSYATLPSPFLSYPLISLALDRNSLN